MWPATSEAAWGWIGTSVAAVTESLLEPRGPSLLRWCTAVPRRTVVSGCCGGVGAAALAGPRGRPFFVLGSFSGVGVVFAESRDTFVGLTAAARPPAGGTDEDDEAARCLETVAALSLSAPSVLLSLSRPPVGFRSKIRRTLVLVVAFCTLLLALVLPVVGDSALWGMFAWDGAGAAAVLMRIGTLRTFFLTVWPGALGELAEPAEAERAEGWAPTDSERESFCSGVGLRRGLRGFAVVDEAAVGITALPEPTPVPVAACAEGGAPRLEDDPTELSELAVARGGAPRRGEGSTEGAGTGDLLFC